MSTDPYDFRALHLEHLRLRREQIDADLRTAVSQGRKDGLTWQQIADALGMTRQSAWEKYRAHTSR
jgi:uncharacterized NAD(P)/FAD-binding protein YdhS